MATINLGAFVRSIRGKAGNTVFSQTKRGTVARDRVLPTAPASAAQIAIRNNMRKDGAAWKLLTPAQVAAWNAYAATTTKKGRKSGKSYVPSGYNVYTGLTTKFYQINPAGTAPVAPPTAAFAGDVITVTATAGTGQVTFTASAANATNVKTELLVQTLKGKNRKAGAKGYASKAFVAFAAGSLSSVVSIPTGYYAVGYRFVNTLTGQETAITPIATVTVALAVTGSGSGSATSGSAKKSAA